MVMGKFHVRYNVKSDTFECSERQCKEAASVSLAVLRMFVFVFTVGVYMYVGVRAGAGADTAIILLGRPRRRKIAPLWVP